MTGRRWMLAAVLLLLVSRPCAEEALPAQSEFVPPQGKGRVVVVVSGVTGPGNYTEVAKELAAQGYYAILVDGNDIFVKGGEVRLRAVLERGLKSPHALPGKAAVVGFSLGGGATIAYATRMPDLVSAAVASYPYTVFITDPHGFVARIKVPLLMFAGWQDTYKGCCTIEMARKLVEEAKQVGGDPMIELVEYRNAGHGWNIRSSKEWRSDVAADSSRRTVEFLQKHPGTEN
jgi:dienelactone hydrolase